MLNCAEELVLIALDDTSGDFHRMVGINFHIALLGALLMDLAMRGSIHVDADRVCLLDGCETGDPLLDSVLKQVADCTQDCGPQALIRYLYSHLGNIAPRLLDDLEKRGIVAVRESKVLWLFHKRCYPVIDNTAETEALTRIRACVIDKREPQPRDLGLISLTDVCDLMDKVFTNAELDIYADRIAALKEQDYIGRALHQIIADVQLVITSAFVT